MTYLGKGGKIPYLNKEIIVRNTEEVLEECWGGGFPVDVCHNSLSREWEGNRVASKW